LVIADSAERHVREIEIIAYRDSYCSKTRQKKAKRHPRQRSGAAVDVSAGSGALLVFIPSNKCF
jgi:hypothetical protein